MGVCGFSVWPECKLSFENRYFKVQSDNTDSQICLPWKVMELYSEMKKREINIQMKRKKKTNKHTILLRQTFLLKECLHFRTKKQWALGRWRSDFGWVQSHTRRESYSHLVRGHDSTCSRMPCLISCSHFHRGKKC